MILAIDPGPVESAWVLWDGTSVVEHAIEPNAAVATLVGTLALQASDLGDPDTLAIEMVESYGMAVGASVFETVFWIGRFAEAWDDDDHLRRIGRKAVKLHLCGSTRAKDDNVRQALIDRFGGVEGKAVAVGKKASPGPLYGIKSHEWAALAVALTCEAQLEGE